MAFSKNMVKPKNNVAAPDSLYDLNITDINGESIHLSKFKGKKSDDRECRLSLWLHFTI